MTDPHVPYQPPPPVPGPPLQGYGPPVKAVAWKVLTIIAAALLAGLGGLYGLGALLDRGPSSPAPAARNTDPTYDVSDCTVDAYGFYRATIHLTNNRSRTASYIIDIEWVDGANTRLATDTEYVRSLGPGQSAVQDAIATGPKGSRVGFCRTSVR